MKLYNVRILTDRLPGLFVVLFAFMTLIYISNNQVGWVKVNIAFLFFKKNNKTLKDVVEKNLV